MGAVFTAHNIAGGFPVAIKWLLPGLEDDAVARRSFLQEARLAAHIRSPYVIKILDVGIDKPYFVMELLEGRNLRAFLTAQGGPLSIPSTFSLFSQIARGVHAAHETRLDDRQAIIHRDLKPDNIFLSQTPHGLHPTVLDFGIARLLAAPQAITSQTAKLIVGTPQYMAKEQFFEPEKIGPWTDVHALGVILYEMLAGLRPFEVGDRESTWDLVIKIGTGHFKPLARVFAGTDIRLWNDLDDILTRAMHPEVTARYPDTDSFRGELTQTIQRYQLATTSNPTEDEYRSARSSLYHTRKPQQPARLPPPQPSAEGSQTPRQRVGTPAGSVGSGLARRRRQTLHGARYTPIKTAPLALPANSPTAQAPGPSAAPLSSAQPPRVSSRPSKPRRRLRSTPYALLGFSLLAGTAWLVVEHLPEERSSNPRTESAAPSAPQAMPIAVPLSAQHVPLPRTQLPDAGLEEAPKDSLRQQLDASH